MKILIEVREGEVSNVWCSEPDGAEVIVRDRDAINAGDPDPMEKAPALEHLRVPHFVIY